jgi:ATP-dependent Clp protease adaptor protein ClpS
MTMATPGTASVLQPERTTLRYPNARVIVLNDDVNTFEHVVECLCKVIPGMNSDKAWTLAHQIDGEGAAEVWAGPLEPAELYHQQLSSEGLTMAPLERN